jgi:hypothetical protein
MAKKLEDWMFENYHKGPYTSRTWDAPNGCMPPCLAKTDGTKEGKSWKLKTTTAYKRYLKLRKVSFFDDVFETLQIEKTPFLLEVLDRMHRQHENTIHKFLWTDMTLKMVFERFKKVVAEVENDPNVKIKMIDYSPHPDTMWNRYAFRDEETNQILQSDRTIKHLTK